MEKTYEENQAEQAKKYQDEQDRHSKAWFERQKDKTKADSLSTHEMAASSALITEMTPEMHGQAKTALLDGLGRLDDLNESRRKKDAQELPLATQRIAQETQVQQERMEIASKGVDFQQKVETSNTSNLYSALAQQAYERRMEAFHTDRDFEKQIGECKNPDEKERLEKMRGIAALTHQRDTAERAAVICGALGNKEGALRCEQEAKKFDTSLTVEKRVLEKLEEKQQQKLEKGQEQQSAQKTEKSVTDRIADAQAPAQQAKAAEAAPQAPSKDFDMSTSRVAQIQARENKRAEAAGVEAKVPESTVSYAAEKAQEISEAKEAMQKREQRKELAQ